MRTRILALLVAAVTASASAAAAQSKPAARSLRPFQSTRELSSFLGSLRPAKTGPELAGVPSSPRPPLCGGAAIVRVPAAGAAPAGEAPAVVRGRVTDSSGKPLANMVVRTDSVVGGTVTNAAGEYRLVLPRQRLAVAASLMLRVSRVGLQTVQRRVPVQPGDSTTVDFSLCTVAVALQGVVVSDLAASVTNTQVAGVDEGGIVKVHGDHLVMLRRGRLFTVSTADRRMRPVSAVNAFGPDVDPRGTWYDELLVAGDLVVVLGFSYARGGTELGLFSIDRRGQLRYRATYHLRSNDYYSSRNYASRLIGTRLVMYTPLRVDPQDELAEWAPAMRRWRAGATERDFRPIAPPTRIFHPGRTVADGDDLHLHTVTTCELARPEVTCSATGVLGPGGEDFFVSATAAYVWVTDWARRPGRSRAPSMLYRLPLDGTSPGALGVSGSPVDQFSFLESGDGFLNVLVMSHASGARMWAAERARGVVSLLRVPLASFSDGRRDAPAARYRPLPGVGGGTFQNRFVGRHLLYGAGSGWDHPDRSVRSVLYATRWAGGPVAELALPHGVDRIEPMGPDAVVVGTDGRDLHFTAVDLAGRARAAQRYVRPNAAQGELRSHGFFYRQDGEDSGMLGLPVRGAGRPGYDHLFDESAAVIFLRNRQARFEALGELAARQPGSDDDDADGCVASCVDWYGNSRPLFLRGRIFALLGYELVEGAVSGGRIREVARVSYAPPPAAVSAR